MLIHFVSIGHTIVNGLALRLGIQLAGATNGTGGMANVTIGRTNLTLHLYKSSMRNSCQLYWRPVLTLNR